MSSRVIIAMLLCFPFYFPSADAQPIPNAKVCVATLPQTGQRVRVRDHVGRSGYVAFASYDPDGWPAITYTPAFFSLPPTVQTFLSLHECGHLVLHTTNEFLANCYAVAQGRWNKDELALIEQSHLSVGRLPAQYGGSGAAFWQGTKERLARTTSTRAVGDEAWPSLPRERRTSEDQARWRRQPA